MSEPMFADVEPHDVWWAKLQAELRDHEDRFADWLDNMATRPGVTLGASWARGASFTIWRRRGLLIDACVYTAKLRGDTVHVEPLGPGRGEAWTERLPAHSAS